MSDNLKKMLNKFHNMDCVIGMKQLPDECVDLTVTSCPYNVDIDYDTHKDNMPMDEYFEWCREWLTEIYRVLKKDGRIAINIPYEVNVKERGGRLFFSSDFWQLMKEVGFKFFGLVDLEENSPHRVKTTAWGSWMSPSSPYIYNPKECVILAYKEDNKKSKRGAPEWNFTEVEVQDVEGKTKTKRIYTQEDKDEFMKLVYGRWKYQSDTRTLTKATFSLDIPINAIKILSYKDDIVMDPFSGSGTTALGAEKLGRNWIAFELSERYTGTSRERIRDFRDEKRQLKLF